MSVRVAALLLTVITGFSGLVYEVAWEKVLATLLGSHSEASAAVLGLFLGGLAVGYALFGALTRRLLARAHAAGRPARLLVTYGSIEAAIGVWALLFPFLFKGVQALSFMLPAGEGLGFALDVGLSALLIGPPAVLMGGTIPILTQALARDLEDATRVHAFVYGFNTVGAFVGALSAGFWILPILGLVGAIRAMGVVNLAAGAAFIAVGRGRAASVAGAAPAAAPPHVPALRTFAAVALLVGFAMMTVQTALIRFGAFSFGASQFTFSTVVAVFVLCIALGSLGVSALPRVPRGLLAASLWGLALLLAALYPALEDAPYWAHVLRSRFGTDPASFYPFHLAAFGAVLALMAPPVVLSGASLPLLFDHLRDRVDDLGEVAGRLYSWNTVGSLLGALLGGYALLFWLDLHHVYRLALAALVVAAVATTLRTLPRLRIAAAIAGVAALVGLALLPSWSPQRLSAGLFLLPTATPLTGAGPDAFFAAYGGGEIRFYDDEPVVSVAVRELKGPGPQGMMISTNGKPDSMYPSDALTNVLLGVVPALFAERAESAFVVGLGTGVTVGTLAALDSMRSVTVAEISRGVVAAAPLFAHANGGVVERPDVHVVRSDAYRALMRSDERFDLIVSQPSNPWVAGVELLYSREFLLAARDRLAPGGVHAQWLQAFATDAATLALTLRTYTAVFEHAAVWCGHGGDLLLLGVTDPELALDLDRVEERARRRDVAKALRRVDIDILPELLAHEILPLGVVNALEIEDHVHTLLHPRLGHRAARASFTGAFAQLPPSAALDVARIGYRNSLLRRYVDRRGGRLPDRSHAALVDETCLYRPRECVALLAQWARQDPDSSVRRRIESALRARSKLPQKVDVDLVEPLSRLYGGGDDGGDGDGLEAARRATRLFVKYYHHGAPFSRRALASAWSACEDGSGDAGPCREGRARVVERLGRLDVELARLEGS